MRHKISFPVIALLAAVLMLLSACQKKGADDTPTGIPAATNEYYSIYTDKTELKPGDSFTLEIRAGKVSKVTSFDFLITYDPALLTVTDCTEGSVPDFQIQNGALGKNVSGRAKLAGLCLTAGDLDGEILGTVTFTAADGASGDVNINVQCVHLNVSADADGNDITDIMEQKATEAAVVIRIG